MEKRNKIIDECIETIKNTSRFENNCQVSQDIIQLLKELKTEESSYINKLASFRKGRAK